MSRSCLCRILTAVILGSSPAIGQVTTGAIVRLYQMDRPVRGLPELVGDPLPNQVIVARQIDFDQANHTFGTLTENFYTIVEARLKADTPGHYALRLISDDGARLWIDDTLAIDHDGLHGPDPKDGTLYLTAGWHTLRIEHFQAGGGARLALWWKPPGADAFKLVPTDALGHQEPASIEVADGPKRVIAPLRRGRPGDGTPVAGLHPGLVTAPNPAPSPTHQQPAPCDLTIGTTRPLDQPPAVWMPPSRAARWSNAVHWRELTLIADATSGQLYRIIEQQVAPKAGPPIKQGCVLRYSAGHPRGVRRLATAGATLLLQTADGQVLQTLDHQASDDVFEISNVRALANGLEIAFTHPLDERVGWEADAYYIEQWPLETRDGQYMSPHRTGQQVPVISASVSQDRRRVFVETSALRDNAMVYVRLLPPCLDQHETLPWTTEAWCTVHSLPADQRGQRLQRPPRPPQNVLTPAEQAAGWRLLFDGKTTRGWRGFRRETMPDGWQVIDGALLRVAPAGDIITIDQFGDFELQLDWRISPGGNSGIFFRVTEDQPAAFMTGPEMQVLDNGGHHDGHAALTSAGANYGLHAPSRDATRPVGLYNHVRLVVDGAHVEHWLNGVKIVEYELWSDDWKRRVAASKFAAWPAYGMNKTGHIALQDHGDRVWYRNIKIRPLRPAP